MILDEGTVDRSFISKKYTLPVVLKYGNQSFGSDWIFQQDSVRPNLHHLTQQWCPGNFLSFIGKNRWPLNSADLNLLDYLI